MGDFNQTTRPLRVTLGDVPADGVLLTAVSGVEGVSALYAYSLDLVAPADAPLDFAAVLGKPAVVAVDQAAGETRFVHGLVSRLAHGRRDGRYHHYRAELVPPLWLLTKTTRSRLFQQKPVRDILAEVIGGLYAPDFRLTAAYHPRNVCAQYRESDFAFLSRVMEEEGIYYYFTHTADDHGLVIADSPQGHDPVPGPLPLVFQDEGLAVPAEGRVTRWEKRQELRTGAVDLTDHTFELPANDARAVGLPLDAVRVGTVDHPLGLGPMDQTAVVDHPGGYARWRDGVGPGGADRPADLDALFEDNGRVAGVRMDQVQTAAVRVTGAATYCRMTAGHRFALAGHFDADGEYVLAAVTHAARCGPNHSAAAAEFDYSNAFECLPADLPFRPQRVTPRPVVTGTQTAVVVGDDPDVDPDKYGRVKVHFRWDPAAPAGLGTSCWVRVAQFWAGRQWGAQFIPRVGDEVVVAFLEGDPDRPLVIGSVYNADNMPVYELPKHKTRSGLKTHSVPHGDAAAYNQVTFEDKKGQEQIIVHAQKDYDTTVEHNQSVSVGNNSTVTVGTDPNGDPRANGTLTATIFGDTSVTITKGNLSVDVQAGTSTTHVKGDVTENYDAKQTTTVVGDQFAHVTGGHHLVKVDAGHASLHVDAGNRYVNVGAGFYDLIAATKITLTTGSSSLEMLADGTITLKGVNIVIDGSTSVTVKGGGADAKWAGGKVDVNGPSGVKLTGSQIDLNS